MIIAAKSTYKVRYCLFGNEHYFKIFSIIMGAISFLFLQSFISVQNPDMIMHQERNKNLLLASLSAEELRRVLVGVEQVHLSQGQTLYNSDSRIQHVYFPTTAIVSMLAEMDDGSSLEVAMIGNEGMVGINLFMGGESTVTHAIVQSPGHSYRVKGKLLIHEFHRAGLMQRLLLGYTLALMQEISLTLACNRYHSMDQQICRWLLLRFDRLSNNSLVITQEHIASLLGVRRGVISEVVGVLRAEGIIKIDRGRIALLDRAGLESRVCECYPLIKKRFDKITEKTEPAR
jgi:CRP-like cAMP-binding protein